MKRVSIQSLEVNSFSNSGGVYSVRGGFRLFNSYSNFLSRSKQAVHRNVTFQRQRKTPFSTEVKNGGVIQFHFPYIFMA
jgi:hypothetical protein